MVSVRRVVPILLLAVTIPAWADQQPQAVKTDTLPAVKTTTTATTTTTTAAAPAATAKPAATPAKTKKTKRAVKKSTAPESKAKATEAKKPVTRPAKKAAAKVAEKKPTHPPRSLHKVGDHWTAYNPPDPSTYPAGSKTYTIKKGDTLWALAKQFYNNAYLWPQLWEANTWVTDAHWIYPGDVLLVEGEVAQQAAAGAAATSTTGTTSVTTPSAAATTPQAPGTIAAGTATHVPYTPGEAVGGTTSPVPLGTDDDVYCFGYIGHPDEPMPNRISAWEDVDVRYQQHSDVQADGTEGDLCYIDGGSSTGLNAGDTYLLVVPGDMIENPNTHRMIGRSYEYRGQIRVLCTGATKSRGLITQSCDTIPIGARLKPLPQIPIPLAKIPSLPAFCDPASGKTTGMIVNAQGGVWLDNLGEGQLVQINLGAADEVQPGTFLTVFRDGPGGTPREVLGELAVLTVENHTATAKVVLMRYQMQVGDSVELR